MSRLKKLSLKQYYVHAHVGNRGGKNKINYDEFFRWIHNVDNSQRQVIRNKEIIAVAQSVEVNGNILFRVISGDTQDSALRYQIQTGDLSEVYAGKGTAFVDSTWIVFEKNTRNIAIQQKRPNVVMGDINKLFERLISNCHNKNNSFFHLEPIASNDLTEEIEKFERLRKITLIVKRPNNDWEADFNEIIQRGGEESNADKVELSFVAPAGEELNRNDGVVHSIMNLPGQRFPGLENVRVTGRHPDYVGDKTISLHRYTKGYSVAYDRNLSSDNFVELLDKAANDLFKS